MKLLQVKKLAQAMNQCNISSASTPVTALLSDADLADEATSQYQDFMWPPTEEQDAFFYKGSLCTIWQKKAPGLL